jgi:hypothetical protein
MKSQPLIPVERIQRAIYLIRDQKVMLDADLAALYGVTTGNLNKAVKRNLQRFPEDFMFELTAEEPDNLRFQIGISSSYGGRRYLPYAPSSRPSASSWRRLSPNRPTGKSVSMSRKRPLLTESAALPDVPGRPLK